MYIVSSWKKKKKKRSKSIPVVHSSSPVVHSSSPVHRLLTDPPVGLSVISGLDYWNGLLEWTLTFFSSFFSFQELTIYIEELV